MYEDEFELTFQVPEEESAPEPLAAPAAKPAAPVEPVVDTVREKDVHQDDIEPLPRMAQRVAARLRTDHLEILLAL